MFTVSSHRLIEQHKDGKAKGELESQKRKSGQVCFSKVPDFHGDWKTQQRH